MSSNTFRKPESRLLFGYPALAAATSARVWPAATLTAGVAAAIAALLLAHPPESVPLPVKSDPVALLPASLPETLPEALPQPVALRPRTAPPLRLATSERPLARPAELVPAAVAGPPMVTASTRNVPWSAAAPRGAAAPDLRLAELTTARVRMIDATIANPLHRPTAAVAPVPATQATSTDIRPMQRPAKPTAAVAAPVPFAAPVPIRDTAGPDIAVPERPRHRPGVVVASLAAADAAIPGAAAPPAPLARPAGLRPAATVAARPAPPPKPVAVRPARAAAPAVIRPAVAVVPAKPAPQPVRQKVVSRSAPKPAVVRTAAPARTATRASTSRGGISSGSVSLIGVFGGADGRHALIMLPNGSVERVRAGDSVQGIQVAAVGADSVQLRGRGGNTLLRLPE